jgi:Mg2+ and Co2+ transporter CorA
MCAIHPDTREYLNNETDLDELVVNALLVQETRPRILVRKEGIMVILRAMNLSNKETHGKKLTGGFRPLILFNCIFNIFNSHNITPTGCYNPFAINPYS